MTCEGATLSATGHMPWSLLLDVRLTRPKNQYQNCRTIGPFRGLASDANQSAARCKMLVIGFFLFCAEAPMLTSRLMSTTKHIAFTLLVPPFLFAPLMHPFFKLCQSLSKSCFLTLQPSLLHECSRSQVHRKWRGCCGVLPSGATPGSASAGWLPETWLVLCPCAIRTSQLLERQDQPTRMIAGPAVLNNDHIHEASHAMLRN